MTKRDDLRRIRLGTVINLSSKKMESSLISALVRVMEQLETQYRFKLTHENSISVKKIVNDLENSYPGVSFNHHFDSSTLRPDGGILYITQKNGTKYPILISEAKRQGTNDLRKEAGLIKQAKGNAIERLGKNVIGLRVWLSTESIFPFVVFGEGIDFAPDSSILDRVSTISMFAPLCQTEVKNVGPNLEFGRGSFYFRQLKWSESEMTKIMLDIATQAISHYEVKLGAMNLVEREN
jgi:type II restriction enzyme